MERLETGIPGLDALGFGGLPEGRTTLLTGTTGSGKTVFALQFLAAGVNSFGQPGVLVTLEEPPEELISTRLRRWARSGWSWIRSTRCLSVSGSRARCARRCIGRSG